ncbi:MAG: sigma 54-interacting transcriptional regulator [Deltaproteobacteria bacterium]|nr:sigma 54-interacting transcriptional regulator [Deltaproteobacteria bacterium]MBW2017315.1 sigma 54-interacting transcriptional regulator [Deltaproteobacteria bacterium]MBW2128786.1 sigma 54-interacting transcriptional regulator [Deltaproteobacteria bacterium]MBW2303789.1 sigma 54-interacting transcriptional regulator [Deltaproteobacteria bacterium]
MKLKPNYAPEFESMRDLLLDMSQERDVNVLLNMIVTRLAARPHVLMARIWLVEDGDRCDSCAMRSQCEDRGKCLHLAASAGEPEAEELLDWKRLPLGAGILGHIANMRGCWRKDDITVDCSRVEQQEWAQRLGIKYIVGKPLLHKGEILGILGLFLLIPPVREGPIWLRMIANHAAIAVANARAFEEIERLKRGLELENAYLRKELNKIQAFGDIIGKSPALLNVLEQIELVAPTDASVLILGESGTGKELVAREIHRRSLRRERPMIKVNCATIPRGLYESEFFGHVKGAFTGALKDRAGRFQAADGGTLFLDEVGEIPWDLQSKLLRVLQEGRYERIGEEVTREVDVRIISATNRDLKKEIREGRFRQDLFYRLNVFPIEVVPLRNRKEDIPLLAAHFLKRVCEKMNRPLPILSKENLDQLQHYWWPGNVRELQNVIERAVITSRSGTLSFDLPRESRRPVPLRRDHGAGEKEPMEVISEEAIQKLIRENTLCALKKTGWKVYGPDGAAALLGVKPTTLSARIKKMGLQRPTSHSYETPFPPRRRYA